MRYSIRCIARAAPIVVTVNDKPDAVPIGVEVFKKKLKSLNMGMILSKAEADVKYKHTRSARTFLKELRME